MNLKKEKYCIQNNQNVKENNVQIFGPAYSCLAPPRHVHWYSKEYKYGILRRRKHRRKRYHNYQKKWPH